MQQQDIIITENRNVCLIAAGSNQDNGNIHPIEYVNTALAALKAESLRITRVSRMYRTPAFPAGIGPDYVNAVVAAETSLTAHQVLAALHRIEADLGREREQRWGDRTVDLDLLDYGGEIRPDLDEYRHWADAPMGVQRSEAPEHLILPHPRIQDRAFVLVPLRDVAPDWRHPVSGLSVDEMIAALDPDQVAEVERGATDGM